jgi:hypothetical protein
MCKKSESGIQIRDEHPGSYFRELRVKILKVFDVEKDPGSGIQNLFDPSSGIRDGKNSDPG